MSDIARRNQPLPEEPNSHRNQEGGTGRIVLAAAIVLVLVLVAGGTTWWMYTREPADPIAGPAPSASASASASACPNAKVRVAAAPEIAPVIKAAARTLATDPAAPCGPVEVIAEEPAVTAAAKNKPDVWIPSSSAWLAIAGANGAAYRVKGAPLAHTPIVLAAPAALADQIAQGDKTSWAALTAAVAGGEIPTVTMPDARTSTIGLLAVHGVNAAMARTTPDAGIAQLRALTLRSRLKAADADPAKLLDRVAGQWNANGVAFDVGVFPILEQQLTAYQRGGHTVQLKGSYPADGLVEADYPFAVARAGKQTALTQRLRAAITEQAVTQAGFRTAATPKVLSAPADPRKLLTQAALWAGYQSLNTQVLLLIDASGSMNQKIKAPGGATTTRAALLRESGRTAAELFGQDTSIGMWFFGQPTPASPPHTEVVPFGPIGGTIDGKPRRDALAGAITDYRAAENSGTPLYRTVLDGVTAMRAKAAPGTITLVVVLTDGVDGESTYKMSHAAFMSRLAAENDVTRPVPVLAVGYGPDVDMQKLTDMSTATGGSAFAATNPADLSSAIAKAFLAAHAPR